jgi:hypothetical protein
MIVQNETPEIKYSSVEKRRANQGVYLIFLKEEKTIDDYDLDELDTDMDSSSSDEDMKNDESNKILVGYMVYAKQRDEFETVCIKEICIHKNYRNRKICKHFVRRMCLNVFREYNFKRVTYTASSFNADLIKISMYKSHFIRKVSHWVAWVLVPGVKDERSIFTFNIDKIIS